VCIWIRAAGATAEVRTPASVEERSIAVVINGRILDDPDSRERCDVSLLGPTRRTPNGLIVIRGIEALCEGMSGQLGNATEAWPIAGTLDPHAVFVTGTGNPLLANRTRAPRG
jgi:hypothetical protein